MEASITERNFLEEFRKGEESGLNFFFREYYITLTLFASYMGCNRELAQEIASGAFVKMWKHHHKLSSYAGIRAYLYKIVHRDCQRFLTKERKKRQIQTLSETLEVVNDNPFEYLVRTETHRLLYAAIRSLAPGYQKVISLYFLEGKSSGEIAKELNASVSTIKTQKLKGLKALRKTLLRPILNLLYLFFIIW
jgi:RNA polymerase sigma factor (sigma-70 family)